MARTDGTYRPGVSIHEAAVMLGVSPTTVRRWVASGRLRSERYDRPQGAVVRVFLGPEQATSETVVREQVPTAQVPTAAPPRADEQAPPDVPPTDLMAAWSETFLVPLVATLERQAGRIGELERENGRLTAELEAERRAHGPGASTLTPDPPDPTPEPPQPFPWPIPPSPNVRALAPWLVLVAILGAAVMVGWWPGW
jgi:excisionase family DNA binding protein